MSEHEGTWEFLTAREFLLVVARLQGVADPAAATDAALDVVDLQAAADRRIATYSRGMRQRARLAAALVHEPDVVLLDEPFSGTDPVQREHLGTAIRRMGEAGRTILLSSHILEEVQELADSVQLLVGGKLAASGAPREIRRALSNVPAVIGIHAEPARALGAALLADGSLDAVDLVADGELRVRAPAVAVAQRAIFRVAAAEGIRIRRITPLDDSLEHVMAYLAAGAGSAVAREELDAMPPPAPPGGGG